MDTHAADGESLAAEHPAASTAETRGAVADRRPLDEPLRLRWWRSRRVVAAALALLILLAGGGWWYFEPGESVAYVSAEVSRGAVAPYVTASGTVNPVVTVQV